MDTTPLILGDTVWAATTNGNLSLVDIKSGEIKNGLRFSVSSNLVLGKDEKVYMGTSEGKILKVNGLGFVEKEYTVSDRIEKGISFLSWIKDDLAVASYDGKLFILKGGELTPEYEFDFGSVHSSLFGEIAVSNDIFAVISSRNRMYVFER